MTTGATDELCGGEKMAGGGGGGGTSRFFTTLSTIAVQAGQSHIIISVLKSGSVVHLQLVQVLPGLCEIGANKEENKILIQEQKQLLDKLKKHETDVLSAVDKKHQTERRKDGGMEEEEVYEAMAASLSEGWAVMLRLLERRQEVLTLASDFYDRVMEFYVCIDRFENLQIKSDDNLTEVQLTYDLARKELLGKSLQVLTSSSILLQKLRQLQRTEALQRTGRVLQEEENSQSSLCSGGGLASRLEQLVEELQDRRRRADEHIRLQLEWLENSIVVPQPRLTLTEDWNLTVSTLQDQDQQSGSTLDPQTGSKLDLQSGSRSDLQSGSTLEEESRNLQSGTRSGILPRSRSQDSIHLQSGSRPKLKAVSQSDKTKHLQSGSISEKNTDLHSESRSNLKSGSGSKETRDLQLGSRSDQQFRSTDHPKSACRLDKNRALQNKELESGSRSEENKELESGSRSEENKDLESGARSEENKDLEFGSRSKVLDLDAGFEVDRKTLQSNSEQRILRNVEHEESQALQAILTNQRHRLMTSCEDLVDKVLSWVTHGSSVLSDSREAGQLLTEVEENLNKHLQLHTQAEAAGRNAESLKQILDQIRILQTDLTSSPYPPTITSRQMSPLKALTEQLKRGSTSVQTRTSTTRPCPPASDQLSVSDSLSPELTGRVAWVLEELLNLNKKINSNLQLLQHYVAFLRTAQQVEEEMAALREIYSKRPEVEEEEHQQEGDADTSNTSTTSCRVPEKEEADAHWQEMLQRFLTTQDLGNNCIHACTMVSGAKLNLESMVSGVQQLMVHLSRTKQEMSELWHHRQTELNRQQEDRMSCKKHRERRHKTQQDLKSVSELLDSCTQMDLGSDLQTSKLLEHFSQARPHFTQLDAEVDHMVKSWETLRGVQDRMLMKEEEEEMLVLLKLHQNIKEKIQQSEKILDLTSTFHLTAKQFEVLLQSEPGRPFTGLTGSSDDELILLREQQQQIQNLFRTMSTLKTEIYKAVSQSRETSFRVQQLGSGLVSLDSLYVSWMKKAARHEEKLTRLLNHDITQLHESFKDLKKRFGSLNFSYLKRTDRSRTLKAVRNQLQQTELYHDKLQDLENRLQSVASHLGSKVRDRGVTRETGDMVNELQRTMREFERNITEHRKALNMSCKLQQAMEEYQSWCEEASATIGRVGKFATQCASTEAVSLLSQQFETFVWPTVPEQEERLDQITQLAVRLHGVEEGRRYTEQTVSKHSEMMSSIRELSEKLMELEDKLKLEALKRLQQEQKKDTEKETKDKRREEETEDREEDEDRDKDIKEVKKKTKQQRDIRSSQEANDNSELKETGHTPELTAEHDGKKQAAANRKPPFQRSDRLMDGQTETRQDVFTSSSHHTSSYCCTQTFSISHSPVETHRRVHAIISQSQPPAAVAQPWATPPPSVIGQSFSDIQGKQKQTASNANTPQDASAAGLLAAEFQQREVMTEDSLSSDEYECTSPDDISLPPLSETPESNLVQSDVEESFCFNSHSVHINQSSHQCHAQSESSGAAAANADVAGVVQQQTETRPSPPSSSHGSTRFRSESISIVQSPLSILTPRLFSIRTRETGPAHLPQNAELKPVQNNSPDRHHYSQPQSDAGTTETPSQTDPKTSNSAPQKTFLRDTGFLKASPARLQTGTCQDQSFPQLSVSLNQDLKSFQTSKKTAEVSKPQSMTQQTVSSDSQDNRLISHKESPLSQNTTAGSEIMPQMDPFPPRCDLTQSSSCPHPTFTTPNSDKNLCSQTGFQKSSSTFPQTSSLQDHSLPQSLSVSPSETSTVSKPKATSSTITQQTRYHQFISDRCTVPQALSGLSLVKESPLPQASTGLCQVTASVAPEPISISSLHEPLTSCCTQQCVHNPCVTPSSPIQPLYPPQDPPEPQAHAASAWQANPHAAPPSFPPHQLTLDQDPDICQPTAIREEITLTPQIQGPPLPQAHTECPPQGKSSKATPHCFTRPLSSATVMGGSPVTLEVEVTGHPEPTLTWWVAYNQLHHNTSKDGELLAAKPGHAPVPLEPKHCLFTPVMLVSDGRSHEVCAANHHDSPGCGGALQVTTRNSSSSREDADRWLVGEVCDIISEEWNTWFGTLCFLLWVIYLIIL